MVGHRRILVGLTCTTGMILLFLVAMIALSTVPKAAFTHAGPGAAVLAPLESIGIGFIVSGGVGRIRETLRSHGDDEE